MLAIEALIPKAHAAEREPFAFHMWLARERDTTRHGGTNCCALPDIPPCSGKYTGMTVAQVKITIVKPPLHLISRLVRNPMQLRKCPAIHATQLVNRWKRCAQSLFPQIELCAVKASGNNKKAGRTHIQDALVLPDRVAYPPNPISIFQNAKPFLPGLRASD